jgi:polyisoprenoid-binding protein YceI
VATFVATGIQAGANGRPGDAIQLTLTGDLTIRGVSRPIDFDVRAALMGDTLRGVATTRLRMSSFGIEPPSFSNILTVADEIGIEVRFTARARGGP